MALHRPRGLPVVRETSRRHADLLGHVRHRAGRHVGRRPREARLQLEELQQHREPQAGRARLVAYTLPVIAQPRPRLDQLLRRPLAPHPPLPPATAKRETLLVTWGQLREHRASRRSRRWASSGPAVRVPDLVTAKQRAVLAALRDAQHANDGQPVGTVAVARWCPEPWTCRAQLVAATLLALEAQGLAICVSELGGRTWRLTEAGRRQLVPRRGPAPARGRRITAR